MVDAVVLIVFIAPWVLDLDLDSMYCTRPRYQGNMKLPRLAN